MSEADNLEDKLERLGWRLRHGAKHLYGLTNEEKSGLSGLMRESAKQGQLSKSESKKGNSLNPTNELGISRSKDKSQENDQSH